MHAERADTLIQIADQMLTRAQHEAERAGEDVVTHMICMNSRQALSQFMQGFLLRNDVPPQDPPTLAGLLDQCRDIDARFNTMDISNIHCRFEAHDGDYCLDRNQVDQCMEIAKHAREIVMHGVPGF